MESPLRTPTKASADPARTTAPPAPPRKLTWCERENAKLVDVRIRYWRKQSVVDDERRHFWGMARDYLHVADSAGVPREEALYFEDRIGTRCFLYDVGGQAMYARVPPGVAGQLVLASAGGVLKVETCGMGIAPPAFMLEQVPLDWMPVSRDL